MPPQLRDQVGTGYSPIADIGICVRNALVMADADEFKGLELKSILFPLIGTGTARGELEKNAPQLINAAISYLETHPESRIDRVYFVTWSEKELEVCQRVLQESPDVAIGLENCPLTHEDGIRRWSRSSVNVEGIASAVTRTHLVVTTFLSRRRFQ